MKSALLTPAFALLVSLGLGAATASAGEITGFSWTSGVASIAGIGIVPPIDPNNDNVAGPSLNVIEILQKDYTGIGPIDIVFDVVDSGGTTEYQFVEGVQNSTPFDWSDYCMQLGFGVGDEFKPSDAGDRLDFDWPDFDSPISFDPWVGAPFPLVSPSEDLIEASGGVMPSGSYAEPFTFAIDVPDGITSFTLRQLPKAVPEPATALLLFVAMTSLPLRRGGQD